MDVSVPSVSEMPPSHSDSRTEACMVDHIRTPSPSILMTHSKLTPTQKILKLCILSVFLIVTWFFLHYIYDLYSDASHELSSYRSQYKHACLGHSFDHGTELGKLCADLKLQAGWSILGVMAGTFFTHIQLAYEFFWDILVLLFVGGIGILLAGGYFIGKIRNYLEKPKSS